MGKLNLGVFGPFQCDWSDGETPPNIQGDKHRAILAMLALAPGGRLSRSWLRDTLWSRVEKEQSADSFRQAISALRKLMGKRADHVLVSDRKEIALNLDHVTLLPPSGQGELLEGIDLDEPPFVLWLNRSKRAFARGELLRASPAPSRLLPRVAIVPFIPRSMVETESHLSDLLALEVSRLLSRSSGFEVISHFSSRQLAGPMMDLRNISAKLDADYLVCGSVGINGANFRLDVDFVRVDTGHMVWSETLEGPVSAAINGRLDGISDIAHRVGAGIVHASVELARSQPLPLVESHALFMSSLEHMHRHRVHSFSLARHMLEQLTKRHPEQGVLHAWLGMWYLLRMAQGQGDASRDLDQARQSADMALQIDSVCPVSLTIDGMTKSHSASEFEDAAERFSSATQIDPSNALAHLMQARLESFHGNGSTAVESAERAQRLSPLDPQAYFFEVMRATAYLVDGQLERAREIAELSVASNPRHTSSLRCLIVAAHKMGDEERVRSAMFQLRQLEPELTATAYLAKHPAADLPVGRDWADTLLAAGLPL
ncbi:MAG: hypothetical protein AAGK33_00860 [Pseudomonadota bacterium]